MTHCRCGRLRTEPLADRKRLRSKTVTARVFPHNQPLRQVHCRDRCSPFTPRSASPFPVWVSWLGATARRMKLWIRPANRKSADGEERSSLEALAETVIGAAYEVSIVLGAGFAEKSTSGHYSKNSNSAIFRRLPRHHSQWCTGESTWECIRRIW
jgi:hypothetical protein